MLGFLRSKRAPVGDGPYRSQSLTEPPKGTPRWVFIPLGIAVVLWVLFNVLEEEPTVTPSVADVPEVLLAQFATFPYADSELPVAAPLDPLLAADGPGMLGILSPPAGAQRIARGGTLTFRFNRPMVDGAQVGTPLVAVPLEFAPAVRGTGYWASRSRLVFTAHASAWDRSLETRVEVAEWLRSLDGSQVFDEEERVVVFDGTPHLARSDTRTVSPGESLPLYFDNPVRAAELSRDVLVYEMGGAYRSIPFQLAPRGTEEQLFRIDLRPGRRLEEGARIGVAIAPRWMQWGGATPSTVQFRVQPPPHIEGVACPEQVRFGRCDHDARPGRIVEIGPVLRVRASETIAPPTLANVRVVPALPGLAVRTSDPDRRTLEVSGVWAADQVYEVRIDGLKTSRGRALRRFSPLAVRSAGHRPEVRVAATNFAWEHGAPTDFRFQGIHIDKGAALVVPVATRDALSAALASNRFVATHGGAAPIVPLIELAPTARANVWGRGSFDWAEVASSELAIVALRPGEAHPSRSLSGRFVQRTNLATTARVLPDGVLVWVTKLDDGTPVPGVQVQLGRRNRVADANEVDLLGDGRTGSDGVVWVPTERDQTSETVAVLATKGRDASVLLVEPGQSSNPTRLGMHQGGPPPPGDEPRASVFTDRGAYRAGETVRVHAILRQATRNDGGSFEVAAHRDPVFVRLRNPGGLLPFAEHTLTPTPLGSIDAEFALPPSPDLGMWSVQVVRAREVERAPSDTDDDDPEPVVVETVIGSAQIHVASFRTPSFRVDVSAPRVALAGDALGFDVSATYLFGADVDGQANWSFIADGAAPLPARYREYTFSPVDAHAERGTRASGRASLAEGALQVQAEPWSPSVRTRGTFEVEVTDATGQTTAKRHALVVRPADVEVGLRTGDDWVALGTELEAEAVAIGADDAPIEGHPIRARFVREGWHSWWAWSRRGGGQGDYQLRRDRRAEPMHTCTFSSEEACPFTPTRTGTYRIEVEVQDAAGRTATASRRVYVAGPDEAPDRDPPGAPIQVTPTRRNWAVGETAELAFESPWDDGTALITTEREGVLHHETRTVAAGAQILRIPITEAMVPNAFVSVALTRGRVSEPTETHDVGSPDLRFGVAELEVKPRGANYEVVITAPEHAEPGDEITVTATARTTDGTPASGEITLWMVDEGLLRLTDYDITDPTAGLFPRLSPAFSWEDLRRKLASRITPSEWRGGGGGGGGGNRTLRPDEAVLDPVPLWTTRTTDAQGRVSAQVTLPERATEYRILALAVDGTIGHGDATSRTVVSQPLVLSDALPRFVTSQDEIDGAIFVHAPPSPDGTEADVTGELRVQVNGADIVRETLTLRSGETRRVEVPLDTRTRSESLRVVAAIDDVTLTRTIPISARAHWRRQFAVGGAQLRNAETETPHALSVPAHEVTLRLGPVERGQVTVTVAPHPFVGSARVRAHLEANGWGHVQHRAATLLALAAEIELAQTDPSAASIEELHAHGAAAVRALLQHQRSDGGFGRWAHDGWAQQWESTLGTRALVRAQATGIPVDRSAVRRAVRRLREALERESFDDGGDMVGADATALGLHTLREADDSYPEGVDALYERREQLGLAGLAHLALAMHDDDVRRAGLATDAVRYATGDHREDSALSMRLRHPDLRARNVGPVLEIASVEPSVFAKAGPLAATLLGAVAPNAPFGWRDAADAADALTGLAAFANAFVAAQSSSPVEVSLDGQRLSSADARVVDGGSGGRTFHIDARELADADHVLRFEGDGPVFFAVESAWAVPLGPADQMARGRAVAVHRRFETADGHTLEPGDSVGLGEMVRVRIFTFSETPISGAVRLRDRLASGVEPIDAQFATTPTAALGAMLGRGPDDEVDDPRGYHAYRSAASIAHRALGRTEATFYFDSFPTGLQEYTYAVRATSPGTFTLPPAQVDATHDTTFVGRSTAFELRVRPAGVSAEDERAMEAAHAEAAEGAEAEAGPGAEGAEVP